MHAHLALQQKAADVRMSSHAGASHEEARKRYLATMVIMREKEKEIHLKTKLQNPINHCTSEITYALEQAIVHFVFNNSLF